jgi:hypothetical protein
MIAAMHLGIRGVTIALIGAVLPLGGCAYRLPVITPASQTPIHIVANVPEQYAVRVDTGTLKDYDVPHDGRIQIGIPAYRPTCGIYLFNEIKVGGYADPLKSWTISVTRNGKTVRKQSFRVMQKSPSDESGYHILGVER